MRCVGSTIYINKHKNQILNKILLNYSERIGCIILFNAILLTPADAFFTHILPQNV